MEFRRRQTDRLSDEHDKTEEKILELIELTQDAKDKGFLLILLKINSSLGDNTRVVNDVSGRLEEHMETFQAYAEAEKSSRNQATGAKKVWSYVAAVLQTVILGIAVYYQSELVSLKSDVKEIQIGQAKIEQQIKSHWISDPTNNK